MVDVRRKRVLKEWATFRVKRNQDGGLIVSVRVGRDGADAIREAFRSLVRDLRADEEGVLDSMLEEKA
jgi:hypothetical protein